ncbi:MAG TPA: polyphosphate kinase 2 [Beijerinckiaceae bacterium]|nr:polyphosphate kinase 2 [Rhodoblastus sp.]MCB9998492.1 polyphosphate kinase 2 [Methylobacteriaceae bacterium]MCO5088355.1 polyphosphate kinase 2 [Methylobacteriaceae bacterium]HRY04446.1 polyphosphate kinase 2 [Beijerinckiaceae bacterium]
MSDGKATERSKAAGAVKAFAIDAPDLPKAVDKAAIASGGYPYDGKLKRKAYAKELRRLQIELLKLLDWVEDKGERIVIVFEGRDAAGKGGTIARLTQHLNPRKAHIVALSKPTPRESDEWYFQRYVPHLPAKGEIVVFDRSWYNRAVVEPVFGFATPQQSETFLDRVPEFEDMLARDGIRIVKYFLTIGREMQMKRLHARHHDPLKRWKLSGLDYQALDKWDAFSAAIEKMLARSDSAQAPWTVVRANDKRRTRIEVIRHLLEVTPYAGKDQKVVGEIDGKIVLSAASFLGDGGEEE